MDKEGNWVAEVQEKCVISNIATAGVYYWKRGSDFVKYAERMIGANKKINGEYFVCPVYNEAIADGKKIKAVPCKKMWSLGIPEDIDYFLKHASFNFQ